MIRTLTLLVRGGTLTTLCLASAALAQAPDLNVDLPLACNAAVRWTPTVEASVRVEAGQVHYRMPGVAIHADVACPTLPAISHVGFVQFVVGGEARAAYDAGAVVIRFPRLPLIDALGENLPWTDPAAVKPMGPSIRIRLSDRPSGTHPLFRHSFGTRTWPRPVHPELATIERDLRLVAMIVGFDPVGDRFLPIRAWEWGTELSVERFIHADGRHDFRTAKSALREPVELTREALVALAPRLHFRATPANEAMETWWIPPEGSRSRAVRLRKGSGGN